MLPAPPLIVELPPAAPTDAGFALMSPMLYAELMTVFAAWYTVQEAVLLLPFAVYVRVSVPTEVLLFSVVPRWFALTELYEVLYDG